MQANRWPENIFRVVLSRTYRGAGVSLNQLTTNGSSAGTDFQLNGFRWRPCVLSDGRVIHQSETVTNPNKVHFRKRTQKITSFRNLTNFRNARHLLKYLFSVT